MGDKFKVIGVCVSKRAGGIKKKKAIGKKRIPVAPPQKVFKDKAKYRRRKKHEKEEGVEEND